MAKPWEGEGGSFGSWLRQQREIRNITLREISDNTKIGLRYLEALEEDRFEVLPAPIFAKGFLREYAKYVGLDPDEVVNFYLTAEQRHRAERGEDVSGVMPLPSGGVVPPARGLPIGWILVAAGILALLLVVAGVVWAVRRARAERAQETPTEQAEATPASMVPIAPAPAPPPVAPPAAAANPNAPLVVTLSFTAECWVEAVVDRAQHVSELRVQGESMRIPAREQVVLTLGNAGAVRGEVNGRPLTLGSAPGQVVRDFVIDRAMAGLPPLPATPGAGAAPTH
ncbi:MAG TPA: RodZ domain-containing protein [Thermoanaerobaculia bacterium]|nr:RodZ domain-containing protein [Thermoanaerobaculia bacterium]